MTNGFAFHGGLFREAFRRLRTVGIICLVIITLFDLRTMLGTFTFNSYYYDDYFPHYLFHSFVEIHPMLFIAPFIPILLMLWVFAFQNSRRDSDFYHSLPATKLAISTSCLLASVAWSAIIIVGSSVLVLLSVVNHIPDFFTVLDFILPVCGAFGGAMLTIALTFLALTLTGNSITALALTAMFLFGPRLMVEVFLNTAISSARVYPMDRLYIFDYYPEGLLYGQYESVVAWIGTITITVLVLTLGLWLCRRRRSEVAGSASVSRAVQVLMRLVFALLCSIPAIAIIHDDLVSNYCYQTPYLFFSLDIGAIILLYAFVAVAHSLFELITTRSVKKMVRSFPWLIVVALLNAAIIGGMFFTTYHIRDFHPEPDEVDSVRILEVKDAYYYYESFGFSTEHVAEELNRVLFHQGGDDTELTSSEAKAVACRALDDMLHDSYADGIYVVDIAITADGSEHIRSVELSQSQMETMINELYKELPFYSSYLRNNFVD